MSSSSSSPFFKPPKVFSDTGRDSNSGKRRPFSLPFFFSSVLHIFASLSLSFNNMCMLSWRSWCTRGLRHSPSDLALNYPTTSLTKNRNKHFFCPSVSTVEHLAIRYFSYLSSIFGVLVFFFFFLLLPRLNIERKRIHLKGYHTHINNNNKKEKQESRLLHDDSIY